MASTLTSRGRAASPMPTGPEQSPEHKDGDFEVDVLRYVWNAWRAKQGGSADELDRVEIHSVALINRAGTPAIRVEWSDLNQVGRPVHVLTRAIAPRKPTSAEVIGGQIVWELWATAHGTS